MEIELVYRSFRHAQALANNRGYRIPKDFEKHLVKMPELHRAALYKIRDYFRTKWRNINPEVYFSCGFEMMSSFSYKHFFDPRVLRLYIHKDKNKKRDMILTKNELTKSVKYVKNYMKHYKIPSFVVYCASRFDNQCLPVTHYLENNIDGFFMTWLLYSRLIWLTEDEKALVPYILKEYRENVDKLLNINIFLKKLKEIL
jgi:hypothetical protein